MIGITAAPFRIQKWQSTPKEIVEWSLEFLQQQAEVQLYETTLDLF